MDGKSNSTIKSSAPDYVIDIVKLSKVFQRRSRASGAGYSTVKSAIFGSLKSLASLLTFRKFGRNSAINGANITSQTKAIDDLTLRIPRGASVGIIGRNGSGKSTFLKLVTGIYQPTSGTISVLGRVAALIELGAGFHPDFTGRENLHLSGIMHGLSREEIAGRFDQIVEFAELANVIDDPVRTYSSGMFMRLGFSIAVHTEPDILLVDEVLAVGDAGFVAKCKDKIAQLRKEGRTLLLVTHDLESVERWCDEVIWIDSGVVQERGYPRRVIDAYRAFVERREEEDLLSDEHAEAAPPENSNIDIPSKEEVPEKLRWGSREVEITQVSLVGEDRGEKRVFHCNEPLTVEIRYALHADRTELIKDLVFGVGINRVDGVSIFGTNTDIDGVQCKPDSKVGVVSFKIAQLALTDGTFFLDVAAHRQDGYPYDYHKGAVQFSVRSSGRGIGIISPERSWDFRSTIEENAQ